MPEYLLTIIIPHYNTPKLLDKMLESIPKREDVQVIVVDDNSTLCSQELENIKTKHSNIELYISPYSKHSTGLCRNIGIEHSKGRWIMFGDADDFYIDGWFAKLEPFLNSDYDLVYFLPTSVVLETGECGTRHKMYIGKVKNYVDNPCRETEAVLRYDIDPVWLKLHSRELILGNNILFEENLAEDTLFSLACGVKADKIACLGEPIYCITQHSGSKTGKVSKELYDHRVRVKVRKCGVLYGILSYEELTYLCLENVGLQILYSAFADKMGIRKCIEYRKLLKSEHVPVINWRHFNPFVLAKKLFSSIYNRLTRSTR